MNSRFTFNQKDIEKFKSPEGIKELMDKYNIPDSNTAKQNQPPFNLANPFDKVGVEINLLQQKNHLSTPRSFNKRTVDHFLRNDLQTIANLINDSKIINDIGYQIFMIILKTNSENVKAIIGKIDNWKLISDIYYKETKFTSCSLVIRNIIGTHLFKHLITQETLKEKLSLVTFNEMENISRKNAWITFANSFPKSPLSQSNIQLISMFDIQQINALNNYSYLDTEGKEVLYLDKKFNKICETYLILMLSQNIFIFQDYLSFIFNPILIENVYRISNKEDNVKNLNLLVHRYLELVEKHLVDLFPKISPIIQVNSSSYVEPDRKRRKLDESTEGTAQLNPADKKEHTLELKPWIKEPIEGQKFKNHAPQFIHKNHLSTHQPWFKYQLDFEKGTKELLTKSFAQPYIIPNKKMQVIDKPTEIILGDLKSNWTPNLFTDPLNEEEVTDFDTKQTSTEMQKDSSEEAEFDTSIFLI